MGLALLVALGAALRLWQYAADASLWADEADMALNLVARSPAELLAPLQYRQVAPVGWLLAEKAAITILGDGELALRLIPLLASLAALPLFAAVARRTLEPRAVVLSLALFALSPTVIFYAAQVKPYASDIAVALLLLGGVLDLDRRGADGGRAERLGVLGALVVWVSHPAVLLLSGLGAVLALVTSALTARVLVPETKLDVITRSARANDLKPTDCVGIALQGGVAAELVCERGRVGR